MPYIIIISLINYMLISLIMEFHIVESDCIEVAAFVALFVVAVGDFCWCG